MGTDNGLNRYLRLFLHLRTGFWEGEIDQLGWLRRGDEEDKIRLMRVRGLRILLAYVCLHKP